jgi:TRAP-type C4-dicarboxylate transport system substrate-binding protein
MKLWKITFATLAAIMMTANLSIASAKEFKLTMSSSHPPLVPWVAMLKNFVVPETNKRLKAMGGKHSIKWTEAYAGALYNFKNTLEGIQDGLGDVGWVGTLWEPNKMPLWNVSYYAPFADESVLTMRDIAEDMNKNLPILQAQWKKYNQVYLGVSPGDGYVLISKTPINSLADLKGKKIYAPGAVSRWVEGTGAIGVNGGLPVYYNGMKTGIADAAIVPGSAILPFKLFEVAPYLIESKMGGSIFGGLSVNLDRWNTFPPEMKKMFREIGQEYSQKVADTVDANRKKHFKIMASKGAKISRFPIAEEQKWAQLIPDIAGDWVKSTMKKGLPADKILKAFMDGIRKRGGKPLRQWDK